MNKKYFSVDLGRPGKDGGFAGWSWDGKNLSAYAATEIKRFVNDIVSSYETNKIVLVLEAPLWGASLKTDDPVNGHWKPRFSVKIDDHDYWEYEWFTNAGGSAALMAQILLTQISEQLQIANYGRIKLVESYISGMRYSKGKSHAKDWGKPKCPNVTKKNAHHLDALEAVLMAITAYERKEIGEVLHKITLSKLNSQVLAGVRKYMDYIGTSALRPLSANLNEDCTPFNIAIIDARKDLFDFEYRDTLVTWRKFEYKNKKVPQKKTA